MKLLVTGAAGFIGFSFCNSLLQNNKVKLVVGIDNLNSYYSKDLKIKRLKVLQKYKNFHFKKIDLSDLNKINNLFKYNKFDIVINFAAQAGVRYSFTNPKSYFDSNIIGFQNIINAAVKYKVRKFIFASSSSVYGENKSYPLTESSKLMPKNIYSLSKQENEIAANIVSKYSNIKFICLRLFTVYGPFGRPDMFIMKYINASLNNKKFELYNYGNHYRDFTYVDDVIGFVKKLVFKRIKENFSIFNICSSKPIKLSVIISELNKYVKKPKILKKPLHHADVLKTHGSNKKIIAYTKINKFTSIKEGINKTVRWYLNNKNFLIKTFK
jgi:UDP-glucuronate 4-epimerase